MRTAAGGVAGGGDDRACRAARKGGIDRLLEVDGTAAPVAERQIDDLGRRRIQRRRGYGNASGPGNAIGDVGVVAIALAQHAHRQDARVPVHSGGVDAIVGAGADNAHHRRAVPRTVLDRAARSGVDAAQVDRADPVARIGGIVVACVALRILGVAVVARRVVADHVVAGQQLARPDPRARSSRYPAPPPPRKASRRSDPTPRRHRSWSAPAAGRTGWRTSDHWARVRCACAATAAHTRPPDARPGAPPRRRRRRRCRPPPR